MRKRSGRSEHPVANLVIGFAVIGVVVIGVLIGTIIRNVPSITQKVRSKFILNGTLQMPDFPIAFVDGSSTTLYQETNSSDLFVVLFVSVGCTHCGDELAALAGTGHPQVSSARIRYLAVCSDPESILLGVKSVIKPGGFLNTTIKRV